MLKHKVFTHLQTLCIGNDAYLVGGAARMMLGIETGEPKDWDICLNFKKPWFSSAISFPETITKISETYFGGDKLVDKTFYESTILLDVFHRNIGEFLRMAPRIEDGIAIHLETETILQTEEFAKFRVTGERGPIEHRPVRKRISSAATNKGGLY